ncbi:MAG TPA: SpoIID/LytB domain-containing protein [Acidimicrobiales bacterium]|nr:SpoIID/LytB domain-containing protein [Acidimicrobiales bacterium]
MGHQQRILGGVLFALGATLSGVVLPHRAAADEATWNLRSAAVVPVTPTDGLEVDGVGSYAGAIDVVPSGSLLGVVNDVGFEDYLRGLAEVPPTWPAAALEAQAVAARTYALWAVLSRLSGPWSTLGAQICSDDSCQVYAGLARRSEPGDPAWDAAVSATAGQVLLYQGRVIEAEYGSSDGGRTRSGGVPWLPSVDDPDDAVSPLHSWSWTVPASSVAAPLGVPSGWQLVGMSGDSRSVTVDMRSDDGRRTSSQTVSGSWVHEVLNTRMGPPAGLPLALPSWTYQFSTSGPPQSPSISVAGAGFGNQVGMSQYGALGKAQRGESAGDILASYYGGIRPTRLLPGQEPAKIRVALAENMGGVTVRSSAPVDLVGADGTAVARLPAGVYSFTPEAGGVQVRGPSGSAPRVVIQDASTPQTVPAAAMVATAQTSPAPVPTPAFASALDVPRSGSGGSGPWKVLAGLADAAVGLALIRRAARLRTARPAR